MDNISSSSATFVSSESAKANSGSSCGSNFQEWKSDVELDLGILADEYVYKEDSPEELPEVTSKAAKEKYVRDKERYVQWYESNKMALELSLDIMNSKKDRRKRSFRAMNSTPSSSNAGIIKDFNPKKECDKGLYGKRSKSSC